MNINKEMLEHDLHINKLNQQEIANKYQVSVVLIKQLQKKYKTQILNINGAKVPRSLTEEQKQIIYGSILGLSDIVKDDPECKLRVLEPKRCGGLLMQKFDLLKDLVRSEIESSKRTKINNRKESCLSFKTLGHDYFTYLYNELYVNGKKTIPLYIVEKLDELGLAILYFDIGSRRKLCRDFIFDLPEEEIKKLGDVMMLKWELKTEIVKYNWGRKLRMWRRDRIKFDEMMSKYKKEWNVYYP